MKLRLSHKVSSQPRLCNAVRVYVCDTCHGFPSALRYSVDPLNALMQACLGAEHVT